MTRQQLTTVLILVMLAVCACGVNNGVYIYTTAAVDLAPAWHPVPRYVQAAVTVEPLHMEADGWKAGP